MRRAKGLSVFALCRAASVQPSTWWRLRTGRTARIRRGTVQKLLAALNDKPVERIALDDHHAPRVIRAIYRGHVLHIAALFGLRGEDVLDRPEAREFWEVRALAMSCTSTDFGIRGADLARAIGVSKQVVSWNLKKAEDMRDDPKVDALVERMGRLIAAKEA